MENNKQAELAHLQSYFKDYKKKQREALTNKSKTKEEILAKYFTPRNNREVFRILPVKPGRKFVEEAFFHVVTTVGSGGKIKHGTIIYCPAHNDPKVQKLDEKGNPLFDKNGNAVMIPAPCPLCDKYKKILTKQDPSLRGVKKDSMNETQKLIKTKNDAIYKEAIKWEAKKFYMIRGIDRGAEKDGVKFWRFKHNFKNQGTLDKLLPILEEFVAVKKKDFMDVNEGADLSIIMADAEFNGRTYKQISAITHRDPSPLHTDPLVKEQWLDDPITWRDVFKAKKAPNITPYQFLELVVEGNTPYWDDSDQNNKRWVFPNHPDLETAANTRTQNFDADKEEKFEQASDLEYVADNVNISNVNESNVGTFSDNAEDIESSVLGEKIETESFETTNDYDDSDMDVESDDAYDDLPF